MTFAELLAMQTEHFPGGEVGEDQEGQLVIYTGLKDTNGGDLQDVEL